MVSETTDPEYVRYRRRYPPFPGVAETVSALRRRAVRGSQLDALLADLRANASHVLDEIIAAIEGEADEWVRTLLVGELAETGDPRLVAFFTHLLTDADADADVARWAEAGLATIGTREARRALFAHRPPANPPPRPHPPCHPTPRTGPWDRSGCPATRRVPRGDRNPATADQPSRRPDAHR